MSEAIGWTRYLAGFIGEGIGQEDVRAEGSRRGWRPAWQGPHNGRSAARVCHASFAFLTEQALLPTNAVVALCRTEGLGWGSREGFGSRELPRVRACE